MCILKHQKKKMFRKNIKKWQHANDTLKDIFSSRASAASRADGPNVVN